MAISKNESSIICIHIHTSPHTKEGRNVEACKKHNHQTAAVSNKMANGVFCGAVQTNTFFTFKLLLQIHTQNFIHAHKKVQPSCFNCHATHKYSRELHKDHVAEFHPN